MINQMLAIKKNMTSTYDARGRRVGATILEVAPNHITQIKTADGNDGYTAVQVGIGSKKSVRKPQLGHFKKAGIDASLSFLREVKADSVDDMSPGTAVQVGDVFKTGDVVKVTGISKGRGFQGGVRRHGFHGGPKTHGQSDRHRAPGSIGQTTTPGRVYKGKKMAGHMGVDTVSVRNVEVLLVDKKNNQMIVKGGVPGAPGALITITRLGVLKGYTPPPEPEEEETEEALADTSGTAAPVEAEHETHEQVSAEPAEQTTQNDAETTEALGVEATEETPSEEAHVASVEESNEEGESNNG
jgi:large subunit ribosomal protein L3